MLRDGRVVYFEGLRRSARPTDATARGAGADAGAQARSPVKFSPRRPAIW